MGKRGSFGGVRLHHAQQTLRAQRAAVV